MSSKRTRTAILFCSKAAIDSLSIETKNEKKIVNIRPQAPTDLLLSNKPTFVKIIPTSVNISIRKTYLLTSDKY